MLFQELGLGGVLSSSFREELDDSVVKGSERSGEDPIVIGCSRDCRSSPRIRDTPSLD
jgi:hypothetical protein